MKWKVEIFSLCVCVCVCCVCSVSGLLVFAKGVDRIRLPAEYIITEVSVCVCVCVCMCMCVCVCVCVCVSLYIIQYCSAAW